MAGPGEVLIQQKRVYSLIDRFHLHTEEDEDKEPGQAHSVGRESQQIPVSQEKGKYDNSDPESKEQIQWREP